MEGVGGLWRWKPCVIPKPAVFLTAGAFVTAWRRCSLSRRRCRRSLPLRIVVIQLRLPAPIFRTRAATLRRQRSGMVMATPSFSDSPELRLPAPPRQAGRNGTAQPDCRQPQHVAPPELCPPPLSVTLNVPLLRSCESLADPSSPSSGKCSGRYDGKQVSTHCFRWMPPTAPERGSKAFERAKSRICGSARAIDRRFPAGPSGHRDHGPGDPIGVPTTAAINRAHSPADAGLRAAEDPGLQPGRHGTSVSLTSPEQRQVRCAAPAQRGDGE